ncbi:MAG: FAD:protein FMN transferase [Desulfobacterales bacterium]|jgi:FAD:protein FMN transferase
MIRGKRIKAVMVEGLKKFQRHRCETSRRIFFTLMVLLCLTPCGCTVRRETVFTGRTMGTTYSIKLVTSYLQTISGLQDRIDKRLDDINRSMSIYRDDSEISRFNHLTTAGEKFWVSDDFIRVMQMGQKIFLITNGAWDGTVKPLVDLWGFGSEGKRAVPPPAVVQQRLQDVGFDAIQVVEERFLVKHNAAVSLDLGSIAKGYGVDQIAALLRDSGIKNFMVEIGGEVCAAGLRKDGLAWRIGINTPRKDAPSDEVYKIVNLTDRALATSGDYRNFFEIAGRNYSHVIDPRSGYPVANGVVSASVLAAAATFADGLATALMVMGPAEGIELVNRLEGVECLIVEKQTDGTLIDHYSNAFPAADRN